MEKKRYILIRKIIKGVIVLFWILTFIVPSLIHISTSGYNVADSYTYNCWGLSFVGAFSPYHSIHLLLFIVFLAGFFLSFGNIKTNYKSRILNRNLGNISGMILLITGIGMYLTIHFTTVGVPGLDDYKTNTGIGIFLPIIIAFLVFGETFFLNRVKIIPIISTNTIMPEVISIKLYCSECGIEILEKSRKFCTACGTEITK